MQISPKQLCMAAVLTLLLVSSEYSLALPGQDLQTVINWSAKHPVFKKLTKQEDYRGENYLTYSATGKSANATLNLEVFVDKTGKKVLQEDLRLDQEKPETIKFDRKNAKGIDLIKRIYGAVISADFAASKFLASHKDAIGFKTEVYKGNKYAYIVIPDQNPNETNKTVYSSTFTISPLGQLPKILANLNKPAETEY